MLGKGQPNVLEYDKYMTNVLSCHIYDTYSHEHVCFVVLSPFRLCLWIIPFLVVWVVSFTLRTTMMRRIVFTTTLTMMTFSTSTSSISTSLSMSKILNICGIGFKQWHISNMMRLMVFNKNSLFCSATRRHEINSEYLVKRRSRYCCCRGTFEAWKVINVFSSIFSSVTFSPHNFTCELILNKTEL